MKIIYLFVLGIFLTDLNAAEIKFTIINPEDIIISIDGQQQSDEGDISLSGSGTFNFVVESDDDYTFEIFNTPANKKTFTRSDMINVLSSEDDILNDLNFTHAFTISISIDNQVYTRSFLIEDQNNAADIRPDTDKPEQKLHIPGIAIYDAFALADINTYQDIYIAIIRHYFNLSDKQCGDVEREQIIASNPFLKGIVADCSEHPQRTSAEAGAQSALTGLSYIWKSAGEMDVTNIADGAAKFIVKRTKEEAAIAFFRKFKSVIENPAYKDLRTIFPLTYKTIMTIDQDIYRFNAYFLSLRESFDKDFRNLTVNLPGVINNHPVFFSEHPQLADLIKSTCYIAERLTYNEPPGEIISNFPIDYVKDLDKNWVGAFKTIKVLSASLQDTSQEKESYWVNKNQINKLISNSNVFRIYIGLLYQQIKNSGIEFSNGKLVDFLNLPAEKNFDEYFQNSRLYFTRLSSDFMRLERIIKDIRTAKNDSIAIDNYFHFINAGVDTWESLIDIEKLIPDSRLDKLSIKNSMAPYLDLIRTAGYLVWDIKRRNYASALMSAVNLYDMIGLQITLDEKQRDSLLTDLNELKENNESNSDESIVSRGSFFSDPGIQRTREQLVRFENSIKENSNFKQVKKNLIRFGTFMGNVVQSKNSDQVNENIEAFALPAGSASIKRNSVFNVSLNSYAGFFSGYENQNAIQPFNIKGINSYGLTAPIGISLSWGIRQFSIGGFFSILDIGAIAAFRVQDDTTKQIPTVKLKNIISPGIFFSLGLPDWPISINLGMQVGPALHEVTSSRNRINNDLYWRSSASVCVDIPLMNLYTSPGD